ncbi:MAG: M20/M25/M40 family metallo-hydrolase [Clostridiales bacterium]|nr:M20/M25/M40 family metallo-hydrolase [Clostridiales bacterium]
MAALMIILLLIVLFIALILYRTLRFLPKESVKPDSGEVTFDAEKSIEALRKLIQCRTISYYDNSLEDDSEFLKLESFLSELYPNVIKTCERINLHKRAILLRWKGKSSDKPSVMMAHYDVVPVEEDNWQKAPFEGIIEEGVLWGRGTLDTKVTFGGVLGAADTLIASGFTPEQDIYLAFSGGEEVSGESAIKIVEYFDKNNIKPEIVVDEGGAVVKDVFPGVKEKCGLIGIAEKGMMNVSFSIESGGGHASAPKPHTPIGILSKACCDMENNPFPMHITKPVREMFDTLGRHSSFIYRMIFANIDIFKFVLDMLCKKIGGELNALLRTTVAFTQAKGSKAPNVIPPTAVFTANLRLNPMDTVESAEKRIKDTIKNENVNVTVMDGVNPSPISETGCDAWNKVASAVAGTWEGCIVSPYLMVQCSDSRHYGRISNHVYRFSAMELTSEERASIHGNNERIKTENIGKAVEFYIRLLRQC